MKSVCIWSYSGTHFPAFGLNTERYRAFVPIQSKCGKMWTRITPNTDTFYAMRAHSYCSFASLKWCGKTHVQHIFFFINNDKMLSSLLKFINIFLLARSFERREQNICDPMSGWEISTWRTEHSNHLPYNHGDCILQCIWLYVLYSCKAKAQSKWFRQR